MNRIADIIAVRTAMALPLAWALMMATVLFLEGDPRRLLSVPFCLFVGASATSLVLSCQPGRQTLLHLVNATALLIAAALIGAVRVVLIVF
jgi:peptidoglycan/LPS O-acetylase OafA/YrhL